MSKVWLITGSSRGLGKAFCASALEAGHRVVATARNPLQLNDLVSRYGDRVRVLPLDVTSEAQAQHAIDTAIETFGALDVLVNNAGYGNVCPVEDTSLDDFRAQIETNLFGVIIMTKAALPYFRERRAGHILNRRPWYRQSEQRRRSKILGNGPTRPRPFVLRAEASFIPVANCRAPSVEGHHRLSAVAVSGVRAWKEWMIRFLLWSTRNAGVPSRQALPVSELP
jgi:hypothetical protein